ncbi:MAG: hypothetical protein ACC707_00020 [Thiohalomonadales bacterium]
MILKKHLYTPLTAVVLASGATFTTTSFVSTAVQADPAMHSSKYVMEAKNAKVIRRVLGPLSDSVNGVPAAPVDSFDWAGSEITSVKGTAHFELDPIANTGRITAEWTDRNGEWTYTQTMFASPPHPTGLRIGASKSTTTVITGDPITTNVSLHGDTGAGGPVIPTLSNLITTWGPSKVTLNGMAFDNPYDGPAPMWAGHTMLSEGVRDDGGAVRTESGEIFSMMKKSEGLVYPNKLVFHLVFHDAPGPEMTDNIPPPLSFFYHVTFSDVDFKIKHDVKHGG